MLSDFYKNNEGDVIWWTDRIEKDSEGEFIIKRGELLFSFDKKEIFNLFRDYPMKLSKEQKEIFDKENPYWADFFKDRNK